MSTSTQHELFDPMSADAYDVARAGSRDMLAARHRWPQRLAEIYDVIEAYHLRKGTDDQVAATETAELVFLIANYCGGRLIYIPNSDKMRLAVRDLQMHRQHNRGRSSVDDLAREYGLTNQQVYTVLAEQTRLVRERMQGNLFVDPTDDH